MERKMKTFKTEKGTSLPLMDIKGKDYLQVAHRLVWFREEHPDWGIKTDIIKTDQDETVAQATITDYMGKVLATGHKRENVLGFADHLEKAETGAVGRALAMCGYGTQFAPELEEGERLADAPAVRIEKQSPKPIALSHGHPKSASCEGCGATLKHGPYGWFCPNYKTNPGVRHTKLKDDELDAYLNSQGDMPF
jgi:hypothetical protein